MLVRKHLFTIGLMLLAASSVFSESQKPALLKFSDLQKYDPANQIFRIEVYVRDINKCPPCPPGAMCKPCIRDNVTIVDSSDQSDISKLKRLRVFTDKTDKFKLKKKYLLTVKVKGSIAAGQPIDSVDLVSIEKTFNEAVSPILGGNWTGESLCTIKDSPCHDEHVIYRMEEPGTDGKMKLQMDKVVSGKPEPMGTLNCTFDPATSTITCPMQVNVWSFKVTGKEIEGTLTVADGRLYRRISVKKDE